MSGFAETPCNVCGKTDFHVHQGNTIANDLVRIKEEQAREERGKINPIDEAYQRMFDNMEGNKRASLRKHGEPSQNHILQPWTWRENPAVNPKPTMVVNGKEVPNPYYKEEPEPKTETEQLKEEVASLKKKVERLEGSKSGYYHSQ